jgi:hypothetical protein
MGLYQAVAGAKITAAEWNTFYNLLKGVVGGEDTIKLANNVADTFLMKPNSAPASVVKLFSIRNYLNTEMFAIRSDGVLCLHDQGATPGTLANGMVWRNGEKLYGRLNEATKELLSDFPALFIPATSFMLSVGTPVLDQGGNHVKWLMDKASSEAVVALYRVLYTGTVMISVVQSNPWNTTGNTRWQLGYCQSSTTFNAGFTTADLTAAVPSGANAFNEVTILATLAVTAGQYLSLLMYRKGLDAADTADADMGFLGLQLAYIT